MNITKMLFETRNVLQNVYKVIINMPFGEADRQINVLNPVF